MFFDTLRIKNFGPFAEFQIKFKPVGITSIFGPNGSGKTHLIGAVMFALFGMKSVRYNPGGKTPCEVELKIREGESLQTFSCRVSRTEFKVDDPKQLLDRRVIYSPPSPENKALHKYLLDSFADASTPNLLFTQVEYGEPLNAQSLDSLLQLAEDNGEIRRLGIELPKQANDTRCELALDSSELLFSEGQRKLLRLGQELMSRKNAPISMPLIIDDAFSMFDSGAIRVICEVLGVIGERDQVILLTSNSDIFDALQKDPDKAVHLEAARPTQISSVSYHYGFLETLLGPARDAPHRAEPRFILGEPITVEEDRNYEFKEIKGKNPVSSIKSLADQYVVAFLNTEDRQAGSTYWGIRDGDREVVGVKLNLRERDEIRRVVSERLHQIQPPIAPTAYRVRIHQVYDNNGVVPDLYVVEIAVPHTSSDFLYSTSKGEVYIKTDSGKKKLTPLEIQKEILRRHQG